MRRKSNHVATVFIWLFKAAWYVIKGISLALWWIATSIFSAAKGKKTAKTQDAQTEQQLHSAEKGKKRHKASAAQLEIKETRRGDAAEFLRRAAAASTITLIVGKRGSGKSTLGFRILENAAAQRPCYTIGVRPDVLPEWVTTVDSIEQVGNQGIVLVDEGALTYSSRDSMSSTNKELGKLLAVARHKDISLVLVTQNTGMIDKNVLNLCDTIMLKEGSLLQKSMERTAMKELYQKAEDAFAALTKEERLSHVYVIDSDFEGMLLYTMPSFWSTEISKNRA